MNRASLPRHKLEEIKRKEDELRTKELLGDFVASFADGPSQPGTKTFVRGEVVNPGSESSNGSSTVNRVYKPPSSIATPSFEPSFAKQQAIERAKLIMQQAHGSASSTSKSVDRPAKSTPKKSSSSRKTKSNLEQFKDELRAMQEARDERRKIRQQLQDQLGPGSEAVDKIAPSLDNPYMNTFDHDPHTTNLFLSNLAPETTETSLCETFGKYGPLASVKIMHPRCEEERLRGYLCGFIAFMTRIDADRAVFGFRGKTVLNHEMKMGWAKCINIPCKPIYVPPAMQELALPPPHSGLPFNAQPIKEDRLLYTWPIPPPGAPPPNAPEQMAAWNKMISSAVVKVVIPTDRMLLSMVHRMIEFVVKEGPMFEAMIMSREMNNPAFRFLFDNHLPAHVYYRWKLFSILQGDSPMKWREDEFRMFEGGSLWRPPLVDIFHSGMPKELYNLANDAFQHHANQQQTQKSGSISETSSRSGSRSPSPEQPTTIPGQLTDHQRDRLEDILRGLTPEKSKIAEAMIFCLENADCAEEVVDCISESLSITETPLNKKIARIYLVSDILANCSTKVPNVTYYRKFVGEKLEEMMGYIHECYKKIEARLKAEQFKQRMCMCFRSWEETAIYPTDFLINLQNIFYGLASKEICEIAQIGSECSVKADDIFDEDEDDVDGIPLDSMLHDDIDGNPMPDKFELQTLEDADQLSGTESSSTCGKSSTSTCAVGQGFKQSKWETVDPNLVEKQAVTSSKWEKVEHKPTNKSLVEEYEDSDDDDIDGIPMEISGSALSKSVRDVSSIAPNLPLCSLGRPQIDEQRRNKLREVEVLVMKYCDDLDSDVIKPDVGLNIQESVAKYRHKLMAVAEKELRDKQFEEGEIPKEKELIKKERKRSRSREREKEGRHKKKKKRSRSPSPRKKHSRESRKRSVSPRHKRRRS